MGKGAWSDDLLCNDLWPVVGVYWGERRVGKIALLEERCADATLRFAVERNFEIIGEVVNRLTRVDAVTAALLGPTAEIVAFRNLLIHGYDGVDDSLVWQIATLDVPPLLETVERLLRGES